MSADGLAFTAADLHRLGMKVVNGNVVPIDTPDPVAPKPPRPQFPDVRGSWCIRGIWTRAPKSAITNNALEKDNQQAIRSYWMSLGCTVLMLSQYRASKVALGLPDLYVFGPERLAVAWFWETKRPVDAEISDEQIAFAQHCQRTRTAYGCGPASAAVDFSAAIGLSRALSPQTAQALNYR